MKEKSTETYDKSFGAQALIFVYSLCVWALAIVTAPVALVYALVVKENIAHRLGIWRKCTRNSIWFTHRHLESAGGAGAWQNSCG
jgi:hypothetical protein